MEREYGQSKVILLLKCPMSTKWKWWRLRYKHIFNSLNLYALFYLFAFRNKISASQLLSVNTHRSQHVQWDLINPRSPISDILWILTTQKQISLKKIHNSSVLTVTCWMHIFVNIKIVCIFAKEQIFRTHSLCFKTNIMMKFQFQLHNDT